MPLKTALENVRLIRCRAATKGSLSMVSVKKGRLGGGTRKRGTRQVPDKIRLQTQAEKEAYKAWKAFKIDLKKKVEEAEVKFQKIDKDSKEVRLYPPQESPQSVMKVMTYKFITHYHFNEGIAYLMSSILYDIQNGGFKRKNIKDEKFHLAFSCLKQYLHKDEDDAKQLLDRAKISRYSDQLNYALRHNIPPGLLIGFLYQTGKMEDISKKCKNEKHLEYWFKECHLDVSELEKAVKNANH